MAKETFLVVDNEPHIVELAQIYLEQAGFSVGSASFVRASRHNR